ncbi:MAG TPA: NADH-quinone oxidoreductase subunit NuoE [Trebonia sp.]|jgi:NADH-quinone oxidoreductase subunit E
MAYSDETLVRLRADAAEIVGRYPKARSALLPLLHLVQAQDGYVSGDGIAFCAEVLGITGTEVRGVATFYTMYKHSPAAEYQVGICTNALCAIMGGDQIYSELAEHLGADPETALHSHEDIKSADGKVAVERIECNAACDFAPVVMVNWEFYDNQTPETAKQLVDGLRAGSPPAPTRGPSRLCTWKQASRILAGFGDGQAADGPPAGPAGLLGLKIAHENGWSAPPAVAAGSGGPGGSSPRNGNGPEPSSGGSGK